MPDNITTTAPSSLANEETTTAGNNRTPGPAESAEITQRAEDCLAMHKETLARMMAGVDNDKSLSDAEKNEKKAFLTNYLYLKEAVRYGNRESFKCQPVPLPGEYISEEMQAGILNNMKLAEAGQGAVRDEYASEPSDKKYEDFFPQMEKEAGQAWTAMKEKEAIYQAAIEKINHSIDNDATLSDAQKEEKRAIMMASFNRELNGRYGAGEIHGKAANDGYQFLGDDESRRYQGFMKREVYKEPIGSEGRKNFFGQNNILHAVSMGVMSKEEAAALADRFAVTKPDGSKVPEYRQDIIEQGLMESKSGAHIKRDLNEGSSAWCEDWGRATSTYDKRATTEEFGAYLDNAVTHAEQSYDRKMEQKRKMEEVRENVADGHKEEKAEVEALRAGLPNMYNVMRQTPPSPAKTAETQPTRATRLPQGMTKGGVEYE